jgi:threonylcarbamoyladenosine tRNA methylthiotransferase MtaB
MGRHYTAEQTLDAVRRLREIRDDPFIGCDIITGFPGETAADFEATLRLCRAARFAWIHAFPFSRRPGTAAWSMKPRVSEREAGERAALLGGLAREGRRAYIQRWLGRTLAAVSTGAKLRGADGCGFYTVLTENYITVHIQTTLAAAPVQAGGACRCRITAYDGGTSARGGGA